MLHAVSFPRKEKSGNPESRCWDYGLGLIEQDGAGNGHAVSGLCIAKDDSLFNELVTKRS